MSGKSRRTRRRWSDDFKRRVVAEASQPGVSVAAIARHYDLNNNLLFNWKRRFGVDLAFLPVEVLPEAVAPSVDPAVLDSKIEIQLSNGHRLSISGAFDPDVVSRLVRGLT
jgi:transposase